MKRIVSFLILLTVFIVILTLPATETATAPSHQMPVRSILSYLAVVMAIASITVRMRKGKAEPVMQAG